MNNFITTTTNLEQCVGNTPLVKLQRFSPNGATILAKLEGNNPAGSVKDRPALNMIRQAENKGLIKQGDTLIEATSGNTGIALAMVSAMMGYKMTLLMPKNSTQERKDAMKAYGATLIEVDSMEQARDLALQMQADGKGVVLDQFNNDDNWLAHYHSTAPEIWQQTQGKITHFVSSMGTTGTIMGVAKFLKEKILTFKSSVYSRLKAQISQGFAVGKKPICQKSLTKHGWTLSWTFANPMPKSPCDNWLAKKGFFVGCRQAVQVGQVCRLPKTTLMR